MFIVFISFIFLFSHTVLRRPYTSQPTSIFFYTIAIFVPSTLPHSLSLLLFRLWASSHNSHCNSSDVEEVNQAGFSPVSFTMIVFDQFVSRLVMIVASFVTVGSH